jgi:hypothetical protein
LQTTAEPINLNNLMMKYPRILLPLLLVLPALLAAQYTWPFQDPSVDMEAHIDNIRNGRTYMYSKHKPLYPFGYGLSYTDFAWSNLRMSPTSLVPGKEVTVSVDVRDPGRKTLA